MTQLLFFFLAKIGSHCPKLGMLPIPLLLLYADDMILASHTGIDLMWLVNSGIEYLSNNHSPMMKNIRFWILGKNMETYQSI